MLRHSLALFKYNVLFMGSTGISDICLQPILKDFETEKKFCSALHVIAPKPHQASQASQAQKSILHTAEESNVPHTAIEDARSLKGFDLPAGNWDVAVVASFRYFIPNRLIRAVGKVINVHPSLLPKYRGSSPLQAALRRNDAKGGVCIIKIQPSQAMDTGDILLTQELPLARTTSFAEYHQTASETGANMLATVLPDLDKYWDEAEVQGEGDVSMVAPLIHRDDCKADFFSKKYPHFGHGEDLYHLWRSMSGSGGMWCYFSKVKMLNQTNKQQKQRRPRTGEESLRCTVVSMSHPEDMPQADATLLASLQHDSSPGDIVFPRKNASVFYVRTTDAHSWAPFTHIHIAFEKPKSAVEFMTGYRCKAGRIYAGVFT